MIEAAVFDVDGTVIKGNCTYLFIRHLLNQGLIRHSELVAFHQAYRSFLSSREPITKAIGEALKLLEKLNPETLKRHSNLFYKNELTGQFNEHILARLHQYQKEGTVIFLASSSPLKLISLFGQAFGIPEENITASTFHPKAGPLICHGAEKRERVSSLLNKRGFSLKNTCFFTDNLSDLPLLFSVGKGYWQGNKALYSQHFMQKQGIELLSFLHFLPPASREGWPAADELLRAYYQDKKSLLESAFFEIIPPECTPESMRLLTGHPSLPWDLETMQRVFYDPVYEYLNRREQYIYNLGHCLFLEAAGLDPERYKPLIAIGELLDVSYEMFRDIMEWTSPNKVGEAVKSHIDISIVGNVSIALMTLVSHNLLFNRMGIGEDKQLRLLERFTSIGFNALFGNGLKLYWEQQPEVNIAMEDYLRVAYWANRNKLQIPCDFWLILQPEKATEPTAHLVDVFVENAAIAIQLYKDWQRYHPWIQGNEPYSGDLSEGAVNYLSIFRDIYNKGSGGVPKNGQRQEAIEMTQQAEAGDHLHQTFETYQRKAFRALEQLPITPEYKHLIQAYTNLLAHA